MKKYSKLLVDSLSEIKGKQNIPINNLTNDLNLAAIMSKLVNDTTASARRTWTDKNGPNSSALKELSTTTAQRIADVKSFMQLLPDLKLGAEVLVSSILSPKDMMEVGISYSSETDRLPEVVLASMISIVDEFFDKDYRIAPKLPTMLYEILFETGSYPIAVLPENAIDDIINRGRTITTESFKEYNNIDLSSSIGILGSPDTTKQGTLNTSLESLMVRYRDDKKNNNNYITNNKKESLYISVTDNPNHLRLSLLNEQLLTSKRESILGYGKSLEGYECNIDNVLDDITRLVYKEDNHGLEPMVVVKTQSQLDRRSVGTPLILKLPSESVIPVFTPGNPEDHLGYWVVLDEQGNPVTQNLTSDYYNQLRTTMAQSKDQSQSMVKRIYNQFDNSQFNTKAKLDELVNAYTDIIERDLLNRLRNGLVGKDVEIANNDAIYRIMLTRTLSQRFTQVLYLPKELLTYLAYDYNEYGIGKSLMDDMRIICGLRVITMFTNMMASIKNSIGRTEVNVKFDENDVDPWKTLEIVMGEINRSRTGTVGSLPIGTSGPAEVVDWLSKAGMEFTYEGHPAMPDVKIEFNEKNSNYTKVDTELEEDLRKRCCMTMGIPPEVIDNTFSPEFATTVVQNNLLLSKRVLQIQQVMAPQIASHLKKVMMNNETLINQLREVIEQNLEVVVRKLISLGEVTTKQKTIHLDDKFKKKLINACVKDFIRHFEVRLPKPNSVELENQLEALETHEKAIDKALDQFLDSSFINSDTSEELGDKLDIVRGAVKAMYLREWMAENNFLPEIFELVTEDENGSINRDVYESTAEHINKMTKAFARFIKSIKPIKDAAGEWVEGMGEDETDNSSSDSDSSDRDSSDDDGGDDEFDMGGFDTEDEIEDETDGDEEKEDSTETKEESSSESSTTTDESGTTTTETTSSSSTTTEE